MSEVSQNDERRAPRHSPEHSLPRRLARDFDSAGGYCAFQREFLALDQASPGYLSAFWSPGRLFFFRYQRLSDYQPAAEGMERDGHNRPQALLCAPGLQNFPP